MSNLNAQFTKVPRRTQEQRKAWQKEYNAKRWADPAFRKRHNAIANKSAKHRRKQKRLHRWAEFPFGYQVPAGVEGRDVLLDFQSFLTENAFCPPLAHAYWINAFDPRCDDSNERWASVLNHVAKECPGLDPTAHLRERANNFISENRHTTSS